ncbi:hypothetical protein CYLTODRAFT_257150 [Cylindrobasidium torrendii FP15055 ss-10]|uniref:Uncharacterized protein n=1 Tax=Cylindrobasidium torrendii FP15055 ss-10 TaxID=1314674 RepID=A0A0D7BUG7_9AGAR|nr:hypothetical protein CYLTODRAFT_257150 [Cylindrobasidium torrendii FP15055 ss-10]
MVIAVQNESFLLREAKRCLELRCDSLERAEASQNQHSDSLRSQLDALSQRLGDVIAPNPDPSQRNRQLAVIRPNSSSLAIVRANQDSSNDTVELRARVDSLQHQAAHERAQQQAQNDREVLQVLSIAKSLKHAVAMENRSEFLVETVRLHVSSLEAMADSKVGMVLPSTV